MWCVLTSRWSQACIQGPGGATSGATSSGCLISTPSSLWLVPSANLAVHVCGWSAVNEEVREPPQCVCCCIHHEQHQCRRLCTAALRRGALVCQACVEHAHINGCRCVGLHQVLHVIRALVLFSHMLVCATCHGWLFWKCRWHSRQPTTI